MATTIDIDTGGTFTDGFVVRDGVPHTVKVLTTPHDFAVCFREVIAAAADAVDLSVPELLRETRCVRYATTVGTNALIQRRGPRLGAVLDTGAGAGDPARWGAGVLVDAAMVAPAPDGEVARDGDAAEQIVGAARRLLAEGARSLVVSLDGERSQAVEARVRELFEEAFPRHCLDTVPLLLGSELTDDPDPARRAATALFNAYVHPDVADYLYRAEDFLRDNGYDRPLLIVHNSGGVSRVARTVAARTFNSGPMAGLLGARALARALDLGDLVTLDMGGTSIDVAFVGPERLPMREHGLVDETVEISLPLPEILGLGAGGGSIAWLDDGELRVGPRSAGAKPGPACFGLGGTEPTLTDADVVLGVLRPERFMGGGMAIDVDAAARAVATIAEPLGIGVEQAASRIRATVHRDVAERLAAELRARDLEPGAVTALAFGGNGATHGAEIADLAGLERMVVVPFSPVFSAFGASTADVAHRHEARADGGAGAEELRSRALRDMRGEGYAPDEVRVEVAEVERDGVAWTVVEATAALGGGVPDRGLPTAAHEPPPAATREVRWSEAEAVATAVLDRERAAAEGVVAGPALVDAPMTTCVVPAGWQMETDERGVQRLSRTRGSGR
ncbi:hydantoinase/oxoprolinase family protein [Conexibacter arvalis]|uniref:N-methylhydantoinase A/oxoprolinase/acetone carboxylase beta subunit n=1 Tax=Conexibacter arvalis TaxID=912552 RepID=A0A840I6Z4_9ACTN|nr:hydantoinase/oxoprolinase family protein [Conexibacter arvalis]MBB4660627.1 N-methylhydantoinase A/oxoprolinase/acetone carboxylase beta subunit [Conexibacter arvalis]